jgi:hypothetical protein
MNGVDWRTVRERFRPRIEAARVPSELYRLLSLMVGELDARISACSVLATRRAPWAIGLPSANPPSRGCRSSR